MAQVALTRTKSGHTPIIAEPRISERKEDVFEPSRHLVFKETPAVHTMKELGFPETIGVSPIAVSEPFPLFTEDAVMRMRQEILSTEVFENCQYSSNLAHCYLRGFADKYAPFVYDVWKNPETLAIVSKVAGIDLVPAIDLEIAHINVSVNTEEEEQGVDSGGDIDGRPGEDERAIVGWHTDSYPFVCVTMLSDCTDMVGGETALRTGNGDIMKVRGPQMGCAVVLQGRYIEHQALQTRGIAERITMVTSFRPRNPLVRDDTVLETMLEERIRLQLKEIRDLAAAGRRVPTKKLKVFFLEQERFLAHMNREVVDDEDVVVGSIQQDHVKQNKSNGARKRQRHV
ncbi:hypothetical protein F5Y17DRAFT_471621 [Xylariaceae sp. FL0594]|nr:hypothetical protein F5Y17DRAFT_471621 [Xylariaceae sp. FL0594]